MSRVLMLVCSMAVVLPVVAMATGDVSFMEMLKIKDEWSDWKTKFGKSYSPREEMYRRHVFYQNLRKVHEHNALYPAVHSHLLGLNQFSDLTVEEYRAYNRLLPLTHKIRHDAGSDKHIVVNTSSPLPSTVDWRTKGYVTPIKNQGQCGSCWAFSTTGSVEGQHFKSTGVLLSLSEQQLVDCSYMNGGCDGGLMDIAFQYIEYQPGGLETESEYPYVAQTNDCSGKPSLGKATISGYVDVQSGNEDALQHATANIGPISVGIDASHSSFQSYSAGVYTEPDCSSSQLDHGVLVVGYGTYQGQDYWLVKNSWGTDWGLNGYIMMARNKGNMCGIATSASYPTV